MVMADVAWSGSWDEQSSPWFAGLVNQRIYHPNDEQCPGNNK